MRFFIPIMLVFAVFIIGCNAQVKNNEIETTEIRDNENSGNGVVDMKLTSPAFKNNSLMPSEYTCDGSGAIPELRIEEVPKNAKSLALIMDDPDVPKNIRPSGLWVHWVVWDIPPDTKTIQKGNEPEGIGGNSDFKRTGYGGPCPPDREHRYFFKLYALDTKLDLEEGSNKKELENVMEGHIIEKTELIGLYKRQ